MKELLAVFQFTVINCFKRLFISLRVREGPLNSGNAPILTYANNVALSDTLYILVHKQSLKMIFFYLSIKSWHLNKTKYLVRQHAGFR